MVAAKVNLDTSRWQNKRSACPKCRNKSGLILERAHEKGIWSVYCMNCETDGPHADGTVRAVIEWDLWANRPKE
jgi:ribosomal protein L37AE/L43A